MAGHRTQTGKHAPAEKGGEEEGREGVREEGSVRGREGVREEGSVRGSEGVRE